MVVKRYYRPSLIMTQKRTKGYRKMKNITVALCTDERGGMMFNKRRQSRDRVLIAELVNSTEEKIYISRYSRLLFEPHIDRVVICDDPIRDCGEGGVCFVEDTPILPYIDDISRLVIYNWNRRYPCDVAFEVDHEAVGFTRVSESEFVGSSHEKITKGVYERK